MYIHIETEFWEGLDSGYATIGVKDLCSPCYSQEDSFRPRVCAPAHSCVLGVRDGEREMFSCFNNWHFVALQRAFVWLSKSLLRVNRRLNSKSRNVWVEKKNPSWDKSLSVSLGKLSPPSLGHGRIQVGIFKVWLGWRWEVRHFACARGSLRKLNLIAQLCLGWGEELVVRCTFKKCTLL